MGSLTLPIVWLVRPLQFRSSLGFISICGILSCNPFKCQAILSHLMMFSVISGTSIQKKLASAYSTCYYHVYTSEGSASNVDKFHDSTEAGPGVRPPGLPMHRVRPTRVSFVDNTGKVYDGCLVIWRIINGLCAYQRLWTTRGFHNSLFIHETLLKCTPGFVLPQS